MEKQIQKLPRPPTNSTLNGAHTAEICKFINHEQVQIGSTIGETSMFAYIEDKYLISGICSYINCMIFLDTQGKMDRQYNTLVIYPARLE